jgi:hypothetical protein
MFVDDILLFSKADASEWTALLDILQQFCNASGLSINPLKTTVHYWGLSATELSALQGSFPCSFLDLTLGFKYLGYNLKLGASTATDWTWLVATFERKIGGWFYKWLSLGGRLILVNSVLQSLAVYWMLLERIPTKILSLIRKLSFSFLWSDFAGHRRFHLCRWQTLTRPKREGGWGLKNPFIFNKALLACSFWRAISTENFGIGLSRLNI